MTSRIRSAALLLIALATLATSAVADAQLATGPLQPTLLRADAPILPSSDPDPSLGNAFNFVTPTGVNLNGVGLFQVPDPGGGFDLCTASRIGPRTMILAAHCVTDLNSGSLVSTANKALVGFRLPGATQDSPGFGVAAPTNILVNPFWHGFNNPTTFLVNDIAILQFGFVLPSFITTYDLFLDNPVGQQATLVGDGTFGGPTGEEHFDGRRRWGTNRVDLLWPFPDQQFLDIVTDFDDPNDPFGTFDVFCIVFGQCDTGIFSEAALDHGDSGGPLFVDGKIAGINSFSSHFDSCTDLNDPSMCSPYVSDPTRPDASFGAYNGYATVAISAGFIQSALAPEPSTIVFTATGLIAIAGFAHRRNRRS